MHHFSISTFKTCSAGHDRLDWWQESFPVLATKHAHLLHAMLAFTALHMAYVQPREAAKYGVIAMSYRNKTIRVLPGLFGLDDLQAEEAEACFWP